MWNIFLKPKIGLVLGGGGARGFFHIGVIKALQELKIQIQEICGASIGSIVGAMWAADPDIDWEKVVNEVKFREIIYKIILKGKQGDTQEITKYLKKFIKADRFEELNIKLKFSATDINSQEEIVFNTGELFPGLIASIAIPGIFKPVEYQGRFLVDSGIINDIPVSLIDNSSKVIVSDICGPFKDIDRKSRSLDVLYTSIALLQKKYSLEKMKQLRFKKLIHLNLEDKHVSILDFRKRNFQRLIDLGYEAMMTKKGELL
jgi:NTE family protein